MIMKPAFAKLSATIFLAFGLLACSLGNATGYVPTPAEIAQIQVNVDNQDTITEKFGPPTVVGEDQLVWYYIASYREYPGILPTKEVTRRILAIQFNGANQVVKVEEFSLQDGVYIPLANDVTETGGRELSILDQLIGGIGNFSAESFLPQN